MKKLKSLTPIERGSLLTESFKIYELGIVHGVDVAIKSKFGDRVDSAHIYYTIHDTDDSKDVEFLLTMVSYVFKENSDTKTVTQTNLDKFVRSDFSKRVKNIEDISLAFFLKCVEDHIINIEKEIKEV